MHDYKTILKYHYEGKSQRFIASILKMSRNTVSDIINTAESISLDSVKADTLSNEEIYRLLYPDTRSEFTTYLVPDYETIHKELLKPGVTLQLLWEEYVESARSLNRPFYHRSYFFEQYKNYVSRNSLTMHINHKPGDKMQVDWDGKTLCVTDRNTGEVSIAYVFVATLPFSMKSYVRACPNMKIDEWIICHIEAYKYFDGVSRLLIPDNLKTGVISHKKNEDPVLNRSYQEMADYYDTIIIPARVRKPKDKAAVEGSVGDITNYIFGRIRNRTFFSFEELNETILNLTDQFNDAPFQKREGSRNEIYENEEKSFMKPIPVTPYELSSYLKSKVNIDYHISIDRMNYSVPYEYVGKSVDVKLTESKVDIFYKETLIASHKRLKGRKNQYSTFEEHMPENHKLYKWNGERFRKWALSIGESTYKVIDDLLNSYKAEEQAYRGCLSILKLADKYDETRLEKACKLALSHLSKPGYKNIKMILESNQDLKEETSNHNEDDSFALIRGGAYYGSKNK